MQARDIMELRDEDRGEFFVEPAESEVIE